MKEITEITFDKKSGEYTVHSYDEEKGWEDSRCIDVNSLMDVAGDSLDKLDIDTLDSDQLKTLIDLIKIRQSPVSDVLITKLNAECEGFRNVPGNQEQTDKHIGWDNFRIYYVTDIHIDTKISEIYGDSISVKDEEYFIQLIVNNIVSDFSDHSAYSIILIGGDVSCRFERCRIFYTKLADAVGGKHIFAILGNHEYWGLDIPETSIDRVESIRNAYADLFDRLYISFADDMLFTFKDDKRFFVRGQELLNASLDEIRDYVSDSPLTILGGTGFAGLNDIYNCESKLYRDTLTSRDKEKEYSAKFESIYAKVLEAVPNSKVIVLTHMPMRDWSDSGYHPGWVYVSGHTHRNALYVTDEAEVYSDNQIGYGGTVHLKNFFTTHKFNIFANKPDGIYEITSSQYRNFFRNQNLHLTCNRDGRYVMLKRDSIYCFLLETERGLYILDGGRVRKLAHTEVEYYYVNMSRYAEAVRSLLGKYMESIRSVSDAVKSIGGRGTIHGCIVDIDFFNHLYLNPFDGTLTAYYATDVVNKYVYGSLKSMLEDRRKDLLINYQGLLENNDSKVLAIQSREACCEGPYVDTDIYRISGVFYTMQHMLDQFIIRRWDDSLITSNDWNMQKKAVLNMISENIGDS